MNNSQGMCANSKTSFVLKINHNHTTYFLPANQCGQQNLITVNQQTGEIWQSIKTNHQNNYNMNEDYTNFPTTLSLREKNDEYCKHSRLGETHRKTATCTTRPHLMRKHLHLSYIWKMRTTLRVAVGSAPRLIPSSSLRFASSILSFERESLACLNCLR